MRKQRNVKFAVATLMGVVALAALFPLTALAQIFTNGGFNTPFYNTDRQWNGQYEKVATGWNYFYIAANTHDGNDDAPKLHWMSSAQFASLPFGGLDYHIEGDAAQMLWSSYEFDAGVYQQVSGVTPGHAYRFFIKMTTYWRGPGYPDTDGVMVKRVGIDPFGGTDPTSPNIIWSDPNDNDKSWEGLEVAATAESGTMTVFAKVYAPENNSYNHTDLDMVYFEDASFGFIAVGATTSLTATTTGTTVNLEWSSTADGIMGYEVQYKDMAGGDWITLHDNTDLESGSFTGQGGHTYAVRARTWQTDGTIDVPGRWQETSVQVGDVVAGRVMNHAGIGIDGVTVTVSGTVTSTLSANGGQYALDTGAGTFSVFADDFGNLIAPPPGQVTVLPNDVGVFDITLRPTGTDQGLQNNDFETDLFNWNVSDGSAAGLSLLDNHTGNGSLLISNTVTVSQTGVVTGMLNPLLSFWVNADTPFTVEFLGAGSSDVQTRLLSAAAGWQYVTIDWPTTGVYSGTVGVRFSYSGVGANIFIDEVSIAEGPYRIYLPLLMKN